LDGRQVEEWPYVQFPSCPFTGARTCHCDFLFFSAFSALTF